MVTGGSHQLPSEAHLRALFLVLLPGLGAVVGAVEDPLVQLLPESADAFRRTCD